MEEPNDQEVKELELWIKHVSQSRPELGNFAICPFASRAHYKIVKCSINSITPIEGYSVVLYLIDENNLETTQQWVSYYNKKYSSWKFFEDCATYDTFINGVQTNNGKHNLIIGQPLTELIDARKALKKTSYYSYWSSEYYNEIVGD